jgi:hypothetical protein
LSRSYCANELLLIRVINCMYTQSTRDLVYGRILVKRR